MKTKAKLKKHIKNNSTLTLVIVLLSLSFWLGSQALAEVKLPQPDHPPELYSTQLRDDLREVYLTSLQGAKKSILLIVYALTDPQIIDILKIKADEGLSVQVICDVKASVQAKKRLGQKVHTVRRSAPGLMHQKILMIDGKSCWIGSANMTTDSLKMHGNLVIAMEDEALAEAILAKSQGMAEDGKALPYPTKTFSVGNQQVDLCFLPDDKNAVKRLIKLIDEAKKSIRIAMFTWTHPLLTEAVIRAHQRGVHTEIAIDRYAGHGSSAEVVKHLKNSGISLRLSQGPALLHYKMMLIDNTVLVNGSANWTRAAFTQNDDCFMILHNLTTKQQSVMADLWKTIWTEAAP